MHLIHSNGSSRLSIIKKYQLLLGTRPLGLFSDMYVCVHVYMCVGVCVCVGGGGVAVSNQAG